MFDILAFVMGSFVMFFAIMCFVVGYGFGRFHYYISVRCSESRSGSRVATQEENLLESPIEYANANSGEREERLEKVWVPEHARKLPSGKYIKVHGHYRETKEQESVKSKEKKR